ncbi:MAG: hypothetical protein HY077_03105 [Elusimicrobia bacterium]|nr:hypothetical protein [Elusimicrobiota bacterium]
MARRLVHALLGASLSTSAFAARKDSPSLPVRDEAHSVKLMAYDRKGKVLDLNAFLAYIGRADRPDPPDPRQSAIVAEAPDGMGFQKARLSQKGPLLLLSWDKLGRVRLSLPWPVEDDGFSTVWIDRDSQGYADGDVVYLNEEIARTQYRLFRDAWLRHTKDMDPLYQPSSKAQKFYEKAKEGIAKAEAAKEGPKRAEAFDKALYDTALAWEKLLFEHGVQMSHGDKTGRSERFGVTLDASIVDRMDDYPDVIEAISKAGFNWVRLVFRPNSTDFIYGSQRSFNEYDAVVKELRGRGLRIMGTVLDTNQWPSKLTPSVYSDRTRNLVLHYSDQIKTWEVGSEINGDWLGGAKSPLSPDQIFKIYSAAAAQVKTIEPSLETVATLYWWDGTAPDEVHTLYGWLTRYVPMGFGKNLDIAALSLWPEDNPVGTAFEPVFERLREVLPDKRIMLGSFGYVEQTDVKGYWWLHPSDVDGGRKDLAILYAGASCALPRSLCGGFWWQTLDQMLPPKKRGTDLFKVYKRTLKELGR